MRVLYVGAFRFPKYDAAAARVLNIARAMRECGHEVEFISWGGKFEDPRKRAGEFDLFDGFRFTITEELDSKGSFWTKVKNRVNRGSKSLTILKNSCNPDLIIAYNPDLFFNFKLKNFASQYKIKYANDITEWSDKNELRLFERITNYLNLKHLTHHIKNRILISSYLANYFSSGNNIIVPPLCDSSESKWRQGASTAKELAGEFDGITLIYAGNPARKDAVHYVINAVQRVIDDGANIRLLILGVERERYLNSFADLIIKGELSNRIQFLGLVPQDEVPSYYALSDFMVLVREQTRKSNAGFPTKFVESFTSGTPVIANLTSDLRYYLFDGKTGFVVKEPTEESVYEILKKKVVCLTSDKLNQMKLNVRQESKRLDYHFFIKIINTFIKDLK